MDKEYWLMINAAGLIASWWLSDRESTSIIFNTLFPVLAVYFGIAMLVVLIKLIGSDSGRRRRGVDSGGGYFGGYGGGDGDGGGGGGGD